MLKPIESPEDRTTADEEELKLLLEAREKKAKGEQEDPEMEQAKIILADENANPEDKNWAKRFSDTKSTWFKERNVWKEKEAALEATITDLQSSNPESLPTNVEELKKWKEEYPDVAKAIEAIAIEKAKELQGGLQEKVESLTKKEQESTTALVKAQVVKIHPEFDAFAADPEFHDWVKEQDEWVSNALYGGLNAKTAIQALTLYKVDNNLSVTEEILDPKSQKKADANAAKLPSKSKGTKPTGSKKGDGLLESDILKWTTEEFTANLSTYKKAKLEGKITYDVSHP
jgi:hypothetical protein|tara:strand:+ start:3061 stop:3921 length:861 start_codon:yes stop_codon:yes gene_type:complete